MTIRNQRPKGSALVVVLALLIAGPAAALTGQDRAYTSLIWYTP